MRPAPQSEFSAHSNEHASRYATNRWSCSGDTEREGFEPPLFQKSMQGQELCVTLEFSIDWALWLVMVVCRHLSLFGRPFGQLPRGMVLPAGLLQVVGLNGRPHLSFREQPTRNSVRGKRCSHNIQTNLAGGRGINGMLDGALIFSRVPQVSAV
jgi:hypothetical protein